MKKIILLASIAVALFASACNKKECGANCQSECCKSKSDSTVVMVDTTASVIVDSVSVSDSL